MSMGTVYRHAVRRVDRRSLTFQRTRLGSDYVLVIEAVRLANRLFLGTREARGMTRW